MSGPGEERSREIAAELRSLYEKAGALRDGLSFDDVPADFDKALVGAASQPEIPGSAETAARVNDFAIGEDAGLAGLELATAAEAVRNGRISSRELTSACLERIERLQPRLNCFIEVQAEAALAAADRADAARARGDVVGRLHGIPLAHKDMFYRRGEVCTCGSAVRADYRPDTTATVLERLDAHGAVTLGRLNMVAFAAGGTGHNATFGACRNPWHVEYSPGGSSSGSGSAVAARLAYGSLGSDTGGSVRLPAAMCGVVGLKPTRGRVSCYGIMPRSWTADVVGPLARSVRDCARMLSVMAGPDPKDPGAVKVPVPDYESLLRLGAKALTVGVPGAAALAGVAPEIAAAIDEAGLELQRLGARLIEVPRPDIDALFALAEIMLKSEAASLHERWIRERPQDYDLNVRSHTEGGLFISATRYMEAQRLRGPVLGEFLRTTLAAADVLVAPVLGQPVPTLEECAPTTTGRAATGMATLPRWTRWVNYLGLPSIAVPCGMSSKGLPIAFQMVGRPFREDVLLRLGDAYQRNTGWHRRCPTAVIA